MESLLRGKFLPNYIWGKIGIFSAIIVVRPIFGKNGFKVTRTLLLFNVIIPALFPSSLCLVGLYLSASVDLLS